MNKDIKYYQLNPSQDIVLLQQKYSLFKQVMNITTSTTCDFDVDFEVMKQAFNKVIERIDSTRLRFVKDGKTLKQYFVDEYKIDNIPYYEFKTEKEQNKFIEKECSKAIKYLKGEVIKPIFIKTYDGKSMIFVKVCHLIFDIYGISIFYKDLFAVYNALLNKEELPPAPANFEEVLIKDLKVKNAADSQEKHKEFYYNHYKDKPEPIYAGIDAGRSKEMAKLKKKGKNYVKIYFIRNQTKGHLHIIDGELVKQVGEYCEKNGITLGNFFLYTFTLTLSKMNNDAKYILPLELNNSRATLKEKNCGGTKVQSINGLYTVIEQENNFVDGVKELANLKNNMMKHMGLYDQNHTVLMSQLYGSPMFGLYYSLTYSFVPFFKQENTSFDIYSNGHGALPTYIALLHDVVSQEIRVAYDCLTILTTDEDVKTFHENMISVTKQIIKKDNIKIKDISVK